MLRRLVVLMLLLVVACGSFVPVGLPAEAKGFRGAKKLPPPSPPLIVWLHAVYDRHCKGDSDTYRVRFYRPPGAIGLPTIQWFVDGVPVPNSNTSTISRSWFTLGNHTVSVTVTYSNMQGSASLSVPIWDCNFCTVTNPKAFFHVTPISACPGEPMTFTGRGEGFCFGDSPLTYTWSFGNGASATGAVVTYAYPFSGQYTVTLTISDGNGNSATTSKVVNVKLNCNPPPPVGDKRRLTPGNPTGMTIPVQCQAEAVASINAYSGNVTAINTDPVPTRGYPLTCNIFVNSQVTEPNRPMGNAAFTHDIHLQFNQTIYKTDCSSYTATVLVDEDGSRYPFTVAGSAFTAARGVFSTLKTASGGYQVMASAPGAIDQAGGFLYDFDSSGRLMKITDPMGNTQTLAYNGITGKLETVTSSGTSGTGKQIVFTWTGSRITSVNNSGQITDLTYSNGLQTRQATKVSTVPLQFIYVDYGYNPDGTLEWMKRNNDSNTQVNFSYVLAKDCNGNDIPVCTGATGGTSINVAIDPTQDNSDPNSLVVAVTNAQGGKTVYTFDQNGDVVRVQEPQAQGASRGAVTEYSYDSTDRTLLRVHLDDGREYGFDFNWAGMPSGFKNPLNNQWTASYDSAPPVGSPAVRWKGGTAPGYPSLGEMFYGTTTPTQYLPVKYKDMNLFEWLTEYNTYGQVTKTTTPGEVGAPSIVTQANYYDTENGGIYKGWAKSAWDSLGTLATVNSYDALGDVTSVSTSAQGITHTSLFTWDLAQRLKTVTRSDGKITTFTYTNDTLTSITGVDNTVVNFGYCVRCGLLNQVSCPPGLGHGEWKLRLERNADHQVTGFVDALNHTTTYSYGQAGELKSVTLPDNSSSSFFYDNIGRLSGVQGGTSTLGVGYDLADRVTTLAASKGGTTQTVTYVYNPDDSLQYLTDPSGRTDVTYYPDGSVKDVLTTLNGLPGVQKLTYEYYANGARKSLTWFNAGATVAKWNYTYDVRGRLLTVAAVTLPGGGAAETTTYSYDNENKLTQIQNANNTNTQFQYTAGQNWVSSISHRTGATAFATYTLGYDGSTNPINYTVGNLTQVAETGTVNFTQVYTYDGLSRMTTGCLYDLAGNPTTFSTANGVASFTYDAANKLTGGTGTGGAVYSTDHDADGNQTLFNYQQGGAFTNSSFAYDAWGHMSSTQRSNNFFPNPITWNYVYDAFGKRVKMTAASQGATYSTRYYIFDGDTLIGEFKDGVVARAYTWGAAGLVSKREHIGGTWKSGWYHFGAQGETRRMTQANGTETVRYWYSPYGDSTNRTYVDMASGIEAYPFFYGGQVGYYAGDYGEANGLYLCGLRWYNPQIGRWLTRDPIGYAGGANLYEYCSSNPVMGLDPSGLQDYQLGTYLPGSPGYADIEIAKGASSPVGLKAAWNFFSSSVLPTKALGLGIDLRFKPANETEAQIMNTIEGGLFIGSLFCPGGAANAVKSKAPSVFAKIAAWLRGGECFIAETWVVMADGSVKFIEEVKEGDLVLSRDEKTGKTEAKRVTAVSKLQAEELVRVELWDKTSKSSEVIVGTPEHPFFTPKGIVEMGKLKTGTEVISRRGPPLVVKSVKTEKHPECVAVYNFEVDGTHTYFVGKLGDGVWVHNAGCGMHGKASTQQLDDLIATDLEKQGWTVTNGAGRGIQEAIKDPAWISSGGRGRPKGTVFPDITATKNGVTMRIQTVDTLKNGQMTKRELNNFNKIKDRKPGDRLYWFPKNGDW